jgi:hypothetical protein
MRAGEKEEEGGPRWAIMREGKEEGFGFSLFFSNTFSSF